MAYLLKKNKLTLFYDRQTDKHTQAIEYYEMFSRKKVIITFI